MAYVGGVLGHGDGEVGEDGKGGTPHGRVGVGDVVRHHGQELAQRVPAEELCHLRLPVALLALLLGRITTAVVWWGQQSKV